MYIILRQYITNNTMDLDRSAGNVVDYENTGPPNEYETIPDPYEGYRHTADPAAIYTLPEPSTASTGPRDSPANSPPTERPRDKRVKHKRRRCAYILVPGIGIILLAGILGYLVWKVAKQNEQIDELTHDIQVMKEECVCPINLVRYITMQMFSFSNIMTNDIITNIHVEACW